MKKRRRPRPRKRKAPIAVEGKRSVEALSSPVQVPLSGDPSMGEEKHDAAVSRPAAIAKTSELADRVDTIGGMTNARGWKIFAGLIVSFLLVASAVALFATHWT